MDRSYKNYIVDMAMLASAILCGITGIIKWPGLMHSLGISRRAIPLKDLSLIHDWTGLLFIAFAALHVIMHLQWLVVMTKKVLGIKSPLSHK
jgi:cytochrome b subunit of formate dehydrogenase